MIKLFTKPATQKLLKELRQSGYTVTFAKNEYNENEYNVYIDNINETPVLRALKGTKNYLVYYNDNLLAVKK